jgi:hypothetical protein
VPRPVEVAFHRPLRVAVTAVILAGAGLAALAAVLAVTHHVASQAPAYAVVIVVLLGDAILVWRNVRWAVFVTLAALAGQVFAVAGLVVELAVGVAEVKAEQLRQLGFAPAAGVIINLVYSSVGVTLFCWFAVRWLAASSREGGRGRRLR